jgi:hypothetical protein
MTAEAAERFAFGLVVKDKATGLYRRACLDTGGETAIFNEAKLNERLRAGSAGAPASWASSRP